VTGVTLDIYADSVDVLSEVFTTAAQAKAFFSDKAMDLGALTSLAQGGTAVSLQAVLTVTSDTAGSGFYGGLLIGDPPAAGASPATGAGRFVQAMAGLAASAGFAEAWSAFNPSTPAASLTRPV